MKFRDVKTFMIGTLRGRLILGVAVVNAVMMALFIITLTYLQRSVILDRQVEEATALAQSLSTSSAVWIKSDDISGLQELVESQRHYPELLFAIITDERGRVLAHSDQGKQGLYLKDLPVKLSETVLVKTPEMIDVLVPAYLSTRHVGWVRVGINREITEKKLAEITNKGTLYIVIAIALGSIVAWWMGRRITRRLYAIQDTISEVRSGDNSARSRITGTDEAASMASEFNDLLDTLDKRGNELVQSETKYRLLLQNIRVAVIVHGPDARILMSNPMAQELLGLSEEQMLGKFSFDPAWQFLRDDGSIMPVGEYPVNWTIANLQPLNELIVGICRPDRNIITWILVNTEPTLNEQGKIGEIIMTFVDISERKKAELKIRHYASIVESSDDAIIGKTVEGIITSWNKSAQKIYGYTEAEIIGKNISLLIPPGNFDEVQLIVNQIKKGEHIEHFETIRQRKDGQLINVSLTISPMLDLKGEIIGVSTIGRDITERKLGEKAIRESEEKYRTLIQKIKTAVIVHASDTQILISNSKAQELLGLSEDQLLGKTVIDPDWHFYLEDGTVMPLEQYPVNQVIASNKPLKNYVVGIHRNDIDSDVWALVNADPVFNREGELSQIIVSFVDITERKRAETEREQYFKFFQASTDLMCIADPKGCFVKINPACVITLGYTEAELLSKPFIDFVHPDDKKHTLDEMAMQLQRGFSLNFENRYRCKDGTMLWLSWRANYNIDEGLTYATGRDITESRRVQQELKHQLDELERFNRAIVGRELRMIQLKKEINELSLRFNLPAPYNTDFADQNFLADAHEEDHHE